MADKTILISALNDIFGNRIQNLNDALDEITIEVLPSELINIAKVLKEDPQFDFKLLIDVCGVDYLYYGLSEWETYEATATGFSRGVDKSLMQDPHHQRKHPRFAVVYHLLSIRLNLRLRIRVYLDESQLEVDSVVDIWPAANWFEREAFDLFGIQFKGHPDLRRILTDYGFVGHPFRKDFPLSGHVEVRFDATLGRVVYDPVSIPARILEPKVIRDDNRYLAGEGQ